MAQDILMIGVGVFATALFLLIIGMAFSQVFVQIANSPGIIDNGPVHNSFLEWNNRVYPRLDYFVLIFFIGSILGLIVSAWFIRTHPVFMVIYIVVWILSVGLSTVFSNVWETVSSQPAFASYVSDFPVSNYLLGHMALYLAVIGFIGIVVTFGKPNSSGNGLEGYN